MDAMMDDKGEDDMMDAGENDMMMAQEKKSKESDETESDGPKDGEYVERGTFCCCCTVKCGIIFFGILLLLDFLYMCFEYYYVASNEYLDIYYSYVYLIILFAFAIAVVFIFYYWCADDSPDSREVTPWAFLLAAIANLLIGTWILIYFYAIYKKDKVWMN